MSYKTYGEYKDSGIKWIGRIPSKWNITRSKFCFNIDYGHYFKSEDFVNEGVNLIRIGDIADGTIKLDNCVKLPLEYYSLFKEHIIKSYDLLIALTGATIGKMGIVPKTSKLMLMNYRVGKINCDNPNYYKYLLNSHFIQTQIKLISDGSAQENISYEDIGNFVILDIDNNTKNKIANYLDKKTTRIDATIAKNEELIQLLEEKRVALINQVVTKGLNPDVPMKDSGVEWIGEIPEHWNITPLKRFVKLHNGKEITTEVEEGDENAIGVYGSGGLFKYTNEYLFKGESVLFGRKGTLGKPIYLNDIFWTVDTMYYLSFTPYLLPKYCYYYLILYPWDKISTETAKPSVVGSDVTNSMFAIPSIEEQKQISSYLDDEINKIDTTISKIQENITLLEEYKTSLIHHVVTGKIDVRGEEI